MKKLLIITGLLFVSLSYGQEHKELLKNKIEIDGHIVKEKIWFKANLDGIEIVDEKGNKYQRRKCSVEKCDVLHLENKNSGMEILPAFNWYGSPTTRTTLAH